MFSLVQIQIHFIDLTFTGTTNIVGCQGVVQLGGPDQVRELEDH